MEEVIAKEKLYQSDEVIECVAIIFPKKYGSIIIKQLSSTIGLAEMGLSHLKRIKKHDQVALAAIVCSNSEMYANYQDILVGKFEKEFESVKRITVNVPRWSPQTRQQFLDGSKIWPMIYHHNTAAEAQKISLEEERLMEEFMRLALLDLRTGLSSNLSDRSCISSGAIIVNPLTNAVVFSSAEYTPLTKKHPLDHAAMRVIHGVSMSDRCKKKDNSIKDNKNSSSLEKESEIGYLCTGHDVYLVKEPCVMCAMALIHSRVRRVLYSIPNMETGGLGSKYCIHTIPSLNHHYRVFRGILVKDCEDGLQKCYNISS